MSPRNARQCSSAMLLSLPEPAKENHVHKQYQSRTGMNMRNNEPWLSTIVLESHDEIMLQPATLLSTPQMPHRPSNTDGLAPKTRQSQKVIENKKIKIKQAKTDERGHSRPWSGLGMRAWFNTHSGQDSAHLGNTQQCLWMCCGCTVIPLWQMYPHHMCGKWSVENATWVKVQWTVTCGHSIMGVSMAHGCGHTTIHPMSWYMPSQKIVYGAKNGDVETKSCEGRSTADVIMMHLQPQPQTLLKLLTISPPFKSCNLQQAKLTLGYCSINVNFQESQCWRQFWLGANHGASGFVSCHEN